MSTVRARTVPRAVADIGGGTIIATVEIGAPPERVFRALTTPEELLRWWGAEGEYRTTEWEYDPRPGGAWRAGGKSADGKDFAVSGKVIEIDRPRKLVQTWKPDWDGGNETRITFTFEAIPEGTRLTLRHEGFAGRPDSCAAHSTGWERVIGWLARHAGGKAPATKYVLCRLIPPRPSFPQDMTPREREAMTRHAAYWTEQLKKGVVIAFGPVLDPAGAWGLGLLEVREDAEVRALQEGDPAIVAKIGMRYETYALANLVHAAA